MRTLAAMRRVGALPREARTTGGDAVAVQPRSVLLAAAPGAGPFQRAISGLPDNDVDIVRLAPAQVRRTRRRAEAHHAPTKMHRFVLRGTLDAA